MIATLSAEFARMRSKIYRQEAIAGFLFALPAILGFIIFALVPMVASLGISFTNWSLLKAPEWVGLKNYAAMVNDERIGLALKNTFQYGMIAVPLGIITSFSVALLLNQKIRGQRFFLTLFYFPSILPIAAVMVTFIWVLQNEYGLLNYLLRQVNLPTQNWLGNQNTVIPSLVLMSVWGAGGGAVIYLASLQGIPKSLYEAAMVDGAGHLTTFRYITLPMVSPVLFFQLVMGMIGALQTFAQAYLLRGGGGAALFYNYYLYMNAFQNSKMGYASAMAWLLFGITLVLTLLVFRSSALWVFYEDQSRK